MAPAPALFVCDRGELARDVIVLAGAEGRHAMSARRITPGERVDLTDGAGLVAECVVTSSRPGQLKLAVLRRRTAAPPAPRVVVVQAILKGDGSTLAVDLMTQVGVDAIVPWVAERSVPRWRPDRERAAVGRLRSTAIQAAKQSRRPYFPQVSELTTTDGAVALVAGAALALLLDPAAPAALAAAQLPDSGDIVLVAGPEGGVSPAEGDAFATAGAVRVRLGPTVLRGSSAGAVAAALILSRSGRWA
jgi:16S rRNA (uracil1498-N3)-methyltransferase